MNVIMDVHTNVHVYTCITFTNTCTCMTLYITFTNTCTCMTLYITCTAHSMPENTCTCTCTCI